MSWKPFIVGCIAWVALVALVAIAAYTHAAGPWLVLAGAFAGAATALLVDSLVRRRWVTKQRVRQQLRLVHSSTTHGRRAA